MRTAVVVGSSVAGVRTAQALRAEGWTGRVVLVGDEAHLPYDRPPLSKQMLTRSGPLAPHLLLTEAEAEDSGIELLLGDRAVALRPQEGRVLLAGGTALAYDEV